MVEVSRRQGRGHGRRSLPDPQPARYARRGSPLSRYCEFLALCVPGVHLCGRGYAVPHLFSVGSGPCSAAARRLRHAPGRCAHRLESPRQHPETRGRRRAALRARTSKGQLMRIAVLGGGSWGTALAILLSSNRKAHAISLWVHDPRLAEDMRRERVNATYLAGFEIPRVAQITANAAEAIDGAQVIFCAMPAAHARNVYACALPHVPRDAAFVRYRCVPE